LDEHVIGGQNLIDECKEDNQMNLGQQIKDLNVEIETYRNAIRDAEDALDSAEKELDQVLAESDELPY
jgi:chaperonin cofactor prefoldin